MESIKLEKEKENGNNKGNKLFYIIDNENTNENNGNCNSITSYMTKILINIIYLMK